MSDLNTMTWGRLTPGDHAEAARLIHGSLSAYYAAKLNQPGRFGSEWKPFLVFPKVYEQLDAGCGICVRQKPHGKLLGVCYYHPRPTHISVGIVATHPDCGGGGVARRMLEEVLALADAEGKEVRLVSSLMNLDSFSLYTRLGFVPGQVFQDVQFPAGRPLNPGPMAERVRPAEWRDVSAMVALERRLCGIDRTRDFEYFLRNVEGCWRVVVMDGPDGGLSGFLGSIHRESTCMVGPGVAVGEDEAMELIAAQLRLLAPENPVVLVPARATKLVKSLYAAGGRNVELHVAQVRPARGCSGAVPTAATRSESAAPSSTAVVMPTFMPESA